MLGSVLQDQFGRDGDERLLLEAVQLIREAAALAPDGHPDRSLVQNTLGNVLGRLARHTGDQDTQRSALEALRAAITALPEGDPIHGSYLCNLAVELRGTFHRTGDVAALKEAAQYGRAAVHVSTADHSDRARQLVDLEQTLEILSGVIGDSALIPEARDCYVEAAESTLARPLFRIDGYRCLARLAVGPSAVEVRLRAVRAVAELVPLVAPGTLARADREFELGRLIDLPGEMAAVALDAGQPALAVEVLEQSRGMLVADALGLRSADWERLRKFDAEVANGLDALRARLDAPDHAATYAAWPGLLAKIRELPGFDAFLRPPGIEQLRRYARDCTIVILTTSRARSDALILTDSPREPVRVVPLDKLVYEDVYANANRLIAASRLGPGPRRDLRPFSVGSGTLWPSRSSRLSVIRKHRRPGRNGPGSAGVRSEPSRFYPSTPPGTTRRSRAPQYSTGSSPRTPRLSVPWHATATMRTPSRRPPWSSRYRTCRAASFPA
jgi:hypothetical protein